MIFSKRQANDLRSQGLEVHEYYLSSRTHLWYLFKELFRMRSLVRKLNPDIVHAHYGTMTAMLGAFSGARKYAITFHGSDLNYVRSEFFLKEVIAKLCSQLAVLRADVVFCVSGRLRQKLWWRKRVAQIVPFGVDMDSYYPMDCAEARARLNIPLQRKMVLFNNSAPVKRPDIARAAVEILKKEFGDVEMHELSGGVDYNSMLLLLNACDCLLICSDSEGSPVMVKEAMACNLPVVATDVGDVASVIEGSYPSALALQQPNELAIALKEILQLQVRSNGRTLIESKSLDSRGITSRIIQAYSVILNPPVND